MKHGRITETYLFHGLRSDSRLPIDWLRRVMKDIGESATVHGFRSSFRDWAGERGTDRQIAELCLAHDTHSDTESAYSRSDMIERRRTVMEEWSKHCAE